jgi:hypothetical protein
MQEATMEEATIKRRDFLITGGAAAVAGALALSTPGFSLMGEQKRARVVLIRHASATDRLNKPNKTILAKMMDEAITELFRTQDAATAWKHIIKPSDHVGIKTNVWNYLRTPTDLEDIVRDRIVAAGVPRNRIATDDRGVLRNAGFRRATALINMRPLRTHHWSGLGTLIKNYCMFVERPADYHGDSCADLAAIWKLPHVAGRTRLNVLVMLTPLFHGSGPHHFNPEYLWRYNGLLLGTDPVAVDVIGAQILEARRREYFGENRPINPPAKHIQLADTRHKLGISDPERIDVIRLGWHG